MAGGSRKTKTTRHTVILRGAKRSRRISAETQPGRLRQRLNKKPISEYNRDK